ncbi:hypothetical protein FACS1894205_3630 [Alphaproteobacteria bacterium]|nr:hypothetical protein FACS1894205_3630 [Alphaproteobacteria bacterium]
MAAAGERFNRITPIIVSNNKAGLSSVYNRFINDNAKSSILVFIHDDVWIDDIFFVERLDEALLRFDIVGIAGNTRLAPGASSWHLNERQEADLSGCLSGACGAGERPFGAIAFFGPTPAPVQLLDGVLLAARGSALLDTDTRFDEQFDFHFYDLDFSRAANAAGLKVGTWPITLTHASNGSRGFTSAARKEALLLYRKKWKEETPFGTEAQ